MSNILKRAYNRFEEEVESDKYSPGQRLAAAAVAFTLMYGGVYVAEESKIDERVIDKVALLFGHDEEITHYDG